MKTYRHRFALAATALGLGITGGALSPLPAQAGLFDFIFGGGAPAPRYYAPGGMDAPLGVRVNPRKKQRAAPAVVKERTRKPKVEVVKIDPIKEPNWYLSDTTLRRGDIIVLKNRVVVFEGSRGPSVPEEFSSLERSSLVSKKDREQILKSARSGPANEDTEAAPKVVEQDRSPRQAGLQPQNLQP